MDVSAEGKGWEQIGIWADAGDEASAGAPGWDSASDGGAMASGDATGWDNTGDGGTKGLLTFLSLGISSFGLSSRMKGSGKKRGSGDFIAWHTSARGSSTS